MWYFGSPRKSKVSLSSRLPTFKLSPFPQPAGLEPKKAESELSKEKLGIWHIVLQWREEGKRGEGEG